MTIYFTVDQHFGHEAIIKYTNRPFIDVYEMDEVMILRWNNVVKPNDIVYHLGDFTLGNTEIARHYFSQLHGKINILSNPWHHDARWLAKSSRGFNSIDGKVVILPPMVVLEFMEYSVDKKHPLPITLCHYPIAKWDRSHYGGWHLHGHSHGAYEYPTYETLAIDVGVDCRKFTPISLQEVAVIMGKKINAKFP